MTPAPVTAYIGLGSNLDHPEQQIRAAMSALKQHPHLTWVAGSDLYQTPPMGPADQPDYINAVACVRSELSAEGLLDLLQSLENAQGRTRNGVRWGPRTLDLDLLLYGDQVIDTTRLRVPHPGIGARNFVLYPMREISPEIIIPGLGPIDTVIERLNDSPPTRLSID